MFVIDDILIAVAISTAINLAITIATNMLSDPIQGPRLSDLSIQTSTYGNGIPKVYGAKVRLAGNVIWSTGLIESRHKRGGFLTPKVVTYSYRTSVAIALAERSMSEGPIQSIDKFWANGKTIFDASAATGSPDEETEAGGSVWLRVFSRLIKSQAVIGDVSFYLGSFEQAPDPTMESHLGAGNVPAYLGIVYVVLKDLQLEDFGRRLPQLQFLLTPDASQTLASIVEAICEPAGIDPDREISTTDLVTTTCGGYALSRPTSCWQALGPLLTAYDFDAAEQDGQLRFVKRGQKMLAVIPLADMGGRAPGEERPDRYELGRGGSVSLPREVSVNFIDPERDYQQNSQTERRLIGSMESKTVVELPVTMAVAAARKTAGRVLWAANIGRVTDNFKLTDRWDCFQAGNLYGCHTPSGIRPFFGLRRLRGANGVIDIQTRSDEGVIYSYTPDAESTPTPENELQLPGAPTLIMLDIPILADEDDDDGYYIVADGGAGWRGALVQRSTDDGATFQDIYDASALAVTGEIDGVIADGPTGVFDDATVIRVRLLNSNEELLSVSDAELFAGANRCWIGDAETGQDGEILQFGIATVVGDGEYELSHLMRGLLGTDYATATHGGYETFVLLERDLLERVDYGSDDWNVERTFKASSYMADESEAITRTFTNTGEGKRPLSPVNVVADRDNYDDLTVGWQRRSRLASSGFDEPPLGENTEAYEIDILVSDVVVDTLEAGAERSILLTAADQIGYGITPGDPVTLDIYQMSATRGRGRPRRAVV